MTVSYQRASTDEQLRQILELQQANLPEGLSADEIAAEGFLTVQHNFELLSRMNRACPHIIAIDGELVVGYTLCMHPSFAAEIEVLKPMFQKLASLLNPGQRFMIMGQVCVAKSHRGQGVFRGLYRKMSTEIIPEFDMIITEVDGENQRSLNAHFAVGFEELLRYNSGERNWHIVALK